MGTGGVVRARTRGCGDRRAQAYDPWSAAARRSPVVTHPSPVATADSVPISLAGEDRPQGGDVPLGGVPPGGEPRLPHTRERRDDREPDGMAAGRRGRAAGGGRARQRGARAARRRAAGAGRAGRRGSSSPGLRSSRCRPRSPPRSPRSSAPTAARSAHRCPRRCARRYRSQWPSPRASDAPAGEDGGARGPCDSTSPTVRVTTAHRRARRRRSPVPGRPAGPPAQPVRWRPAASSAARGVARGHGSSSAPCAGVHPRTGSVSSPSLRDRRPRHPGGLVGAGGRAASPAGVGVAVLVRVVVRVAEDLAQVGVGEVAGRAVVLVLVAVLLVQRDVVRGVLAR